jgi:hypothetical protein
MPSQDGGGGAQRGARRCDCGCCVSLQRVRAGRGACISLRRALKGDDIGILVDGRIVALHPFPLENPMSKAKRSHIEVQGTNIGILAQPGGDTISLTGMVRNFDGAGALIEQGLKNKDTVLFLGVWERINNPDFYSLEFEVIKNEADRNSFFLSEKQWRDVNPGAEGNIRDHAQLEQLVVLTNLESLNSAMLELVSRDPFDSTPMRTFQGALSKN